MLKSFFKKLTDKSLGPKNTELAEGIAQTNNLNVAYNAADVIYKELSAMLKSSVFFGGLNLRCGHIQRYQQEQTIFILSTDTTFSFTVSVASKPYLNNLELSLRTFCCPIEFFTLKEYFSPLQVFMALSETLALICNKFSAGAIKYAQNEQAHCLAVVHDEWLKYLRAEQACVVPNMDITMGISQNGVWLSHLIQGCHLKFYAQQESRSVCEVKIALNEQNEHPEFTAASGKSWSNIVKKCEVSKSVFAVLAQGLLNP